MLGLDPSWGVAGLTASAGLAGWVEMLLLRRKLNLLIGSTGLAVGYVAKLWMAAIAGAAVGWAVKLTSPALHPVLIGAIVLVPYGLVFLGGTFALRVPEASSAVRDVMRRLRRRP